MEDNNIGLSEDTRKSLLKQLTERTQTLNLGYEQYSGLTRLPSEIRRCSSIRSLTLTNTKVTDINAISELASLEELNLSGCKIADMSPLSGLSRLKLLNIASTPVVHFDFIAGLQNLNTINLNYTVFSETHLLSELPKLKNIAIAYTKARDLVPLSRLAEVNNLFLDGSQIDDLQPLLENFHYSDEYLEMKMPYGTIRKSGLSFLGTPFEQKFGAHWISEISNDEKRTKTAMTFVSQLPPQEISGAQSFVVPDNAPVELEPQKLGDLDRESIELKNYCTEKASHLVEMCKRSNQCAVLSDRLVRYLSQVERPSSEVSLALLWSTANSLRSAYEAHNVALTEGRTEEVLPPFIAPDLLDLLETHGVFFSALPGAQEIERTKRDFLDTGYRRGHGKRATNQVILELSKSQAVLQDDAKEYLLSVSVSEESATASQDIANEEADGTVWNFVAKVTQKVWRTGNQVSKIGVEAAIAHDIVAWFLNSKTLIESFLTYISGKVPIWWPKLLSIFESMKNLF